MQKFRLPFWKFCGVYSLGLFADSLGIAWGMRQILAYGEGFSCVRQFLAYAVSSLRASKRAVRRFGFGAVGISAKMVFGQCGACCASPAGLPAVFGQAVFGGTAGAVLRLSVNRLRRFVWFLGAALQNGGFLMQAKFLYYKFAILCFWSVPWLFGFLL